MERGDPILAARAGIVAKVHDGETACGGQDKIGNANYVVIDHRDGTFASYLHLQAGILVTEDQEVQQGQVIGYTGNTGQTYCQTSAGGGYHLHFQVQDGPEVGDQSLPICFSDVPGNGIPVEGRAYQSQNQMVMVQGMQVTRESEGGEYADILGIWEGQISDFVDGNLQSPRKLVVDISDCASGELCISFQSPSDPGPYPLVNGDRPGYCFGDGYNVYCFAPAGEDTLNYQGHGPMWAAEGILHRIPSSGLTQGPSEPLDMTDPDSIFAALKTSLEQRDLSVLGQLLPDTVCISSAPVGCRYLPETPRETALEEIRAHLQGELTCIGYRVTESAGGFRTLSVTTVGWDPEWETASELQNGGTLGFSFSNSWSATPSQSGTLQVASSDELRLDIISVGVAIDEICP